jgi:hypothetical protein
MDIKEIENALNELITEAAESGGCVWIVDKRQNNFAVRLCDPVTLKAYIRSNNESEKNNDSNEQTN